VVVDWLAKLLDLPPCFLASSETGGGSIQGSGSEAVLVTLLAAKARALHGRPAEDAVRLVVYATDQVCGTARVRAGNASKGRQVLLEQPLWLFDMGIDAHGGRAAGRQTASQSLLQASLCCCKMLCWYLRCCVGI
jgi:hypothetical protein